MTAPFLVVRDLDVTYPGRGGSAARVRAVSGVGFTVDRGETVALVGESGCGKTSVARAIVGLTAPSAGTVTAGGISLAGAPAADRRRYRRSVQLVFQDPYDSLNPRKTIFETIRQPLRVHGVVPRRGHREEARALLEAVGVTPAAALLDRYPHQFSGGQRQRIGIARALAVRPDLVVADEPVSALDISIRAQILALLQDLKRGRGLGYLLISHDLGVVRSVADRVLVMYLGQVVEEGGVAAVFDRPAHPYTAALLATGPIPDPVRARAARPVVLAGDPPSPDDPPAGCRFHPRCPVARPVCREAPPLVELGGGRRARCHFAGSVRREDVLAALRGPAGPPEAAAAAATAARGEAGG